MAEASILSEIINRRGAQYGHFRIEACLQRSGSNWEIVFGKATAEARNQTKVNQSVLDFADYVYVTQFIEVNELLRILQEQNPTFKFGSYELTLPGATLRPSGMNRLTSNSFLSDWPLELFELRPHIHQNYLNPKPLVAHNTPRDTAIP
jgi:hypothetical protein